MVGKKKFNAFLVFALFLSQTSVVLTEPAGDVEPTEQKGISAPVLTPSLFQQKYLYYTDASKYQICKRQDLAQKIADYLSTNKISNNFDNEERANVISFLQLLKGAAQQKDINDTLFNFSDPAVALNKFIKYGETLLEKIEKEVTPRELHELKVIFLIKITSLLDKYFHEIMFRVLRGIDHDLQYWKEQQSHKWYYFFHKSPLKWVKGQPQNVEIQQSIRGLEWLKEKHYALMGVLATFGDSLLNNDDFDKKSNILQEHLAWVNDYLDVMYGGFSDLLFVKRTQEFRPECDTLIAAVKKMLNEIVKVYPSRMKVRMAGMGQPSHFQRHWADYFGAALLMAGVSGYCYYYRNQLPGWRDSMRKNYYDPFKEGFLQLFPFLNPKKEEQVVGQRAQNNQLVEVPDSNNNNAVQIDQNAQPRDLKKAFADIWKNLGLEGLQMSEDQKKELYNKYIREYFVFRKECTTTTETSLMGKDHWFRITSAPTFDPRDVPSDFAHKVDTLDTFFLTSCIQQALLDISKADSGIIFTQQRKLAHHCYNLIYLYLTISSNNTKSNIDNNILPEVIKLYDYVENLVTDSQAKLDRLETLTNILACVPLVGGATLGSWLLYRLGKGLAPKANYGPIRTALNAINDILMGYNNGPREMKPVHYGELLYLVRTLEHEARIIPQDCRKHYDIDIKKLESNLPVDRKLQVIDSMYRRYPFLLVQPAA